VCPSTIIITARARSKSRKTILCGVVVAVISSLGKGGLVSRGGSNIKVAFRNPHSLENYYPASRNKCGSMGVAFYARCGALNVIASPDELGN
jgi:hypothetical protein